MYHLRQEFPTSGVWHLMIWGGADVIMREIKCMINARHLNHPETILPHLTPSTNCLPQNWSLMPKRLETAALRNPPIGNSLVVQWWGLCTFAANGPGMTLGWEMKILKAEWHGQKQKKKQKQNRNPLTDSISQNSAPLDSALPTTTLKTSFSSSRSAVLWRPPCIVWVSLAARVGGQEKTHDDRWSELHLEKLMKKKKKKS